MRVFIVSKFGSSQELAKKLIQEEHEVLMYIRDKTARKINPSSFLVDNPLADMMMADLFIIEDDMSGQFADKARELGRPIVGGGTLVDQLATGLEYQTKIIHGCGFKMASKETKGMPITLGGWFCGEEFIRPYFLGVRYSRVGAGEVGHMTRGMGLVGQYKQKGNIFSMLRSMETLLKTSKYRGFVAIQLLINNDSIHVEKVDLGLNFPNLAVVTKLHGTIGEFLKRVATNTAKQTAVQPNRVGVGVVWLPNIDQATICPNMVCEVGDTVEEATSKTYKEIRKLGNEDAYYRTDIGYNYNTYMETLQQFDWV
jgi:hypothetical protein